MEQTGTISGETLAVFGSSDFAERGFCTRCGTHIFHRPKDGPKLAWRRMAKLWRS